MMTRNECAEWLLANDRYCILTHRRPDGDTAGSAAALCLALRAVGKEAFILENPELGERFTSLHEGLTKKEVAENDTVVSVDVASPGMLPRSFEHLAQCTKLRIDHHGSATSFAELELVDAGAGACAEIICDVIACMGVSLTPAMADAIYVGTATDTGCFRFSNTTSHTFSVATMCAQAGAQVYALNQKLFETNTLSKLRMQAWIVEHMHLFDDGRMAIIAIPRAVETELGVTDDDMDNISSFPRTVSGVCMAATLRQTKEGETKLSLRAIPGWDAAAVCEEFGGGGHKGASGASTSLGIDAVAVLLEKTMLEKGREQVVGA